MGAVAIRAQGLGKRYRLGSAQRYKALRDTVAEVLRSPLRMAAGLFSRPSAEEEAEREFWALKDVDFELSQGDTVGVIGRNGAGKSTLLKLLSRVISPTTGEADVHGRVGSLLEVGTGFHPELTGRENVYLNGAILGMKRREILAKFDAIVAFAEVERFLDTPVKQYSSGMYMRLAFAVAAHLEPEILLVDEVLAVGDAAFQKKCLGKMGDVAGEGRTVLFVSHNMVAVEQLCKRVLRLDKGRVMELSSDVRGSIRAYLTGAGEGFGASEWHNPGKAFANGTFTPQRFALTTEDGAPLAMPASNASPICVTIEADVQTTDPALTVGCCVFAEDGQVLFWSFQTDLPEEKWPRLEPGRCVLRGKIPARFLNEGTYRVELMASLHFRRWLCEPGVNAPSIQLTIAGGLSDSPLWMIRRPGLVAPEIPWTRIA